MFWLILFKGERGSDGTYGPEGDSVSSVVINSCDVICFVYFQNVAGPAGLG